MNTLMFPFTKWAFVLTMAAMIIHLYFKMQNVGYTNMSDCFMEVVKTIPAYWVGMQFLRLIKVDQFVL